jgi:hypothetical protein
MTENEDNKLNSQNLGNNEPVEPTNSADNTAGSVDSNEASWDAPGVNPPASAPNTNQTESSVYPTLNENEISVNPNIMGEEIPVKNSRRNPWLIISPIIVLVMLVGVGAVFAVTRSVSPDSGAISPEKAVEKFLEAFNENDIQQVINFTEPALRDSMKPVYDQVEELATNKKLNKEKFGIGEGLFSFDNVKLNVVSYGSDVARVDFTAGTYTVDDTALDEKKFVDSFYKVFPKLSVLTEKPSKPSKADSKKGASGNFTNSGKRFEKDDLGAAENYFFMVTQRDGLWYVSPSYSAMEWLRVAETSNNDTKIKVFKEKFPEPLKLGNGRDGNGLGDLDKKNIDATSKKTVEDMMEFLNNTVAGKFTKKDFLALKDSYVSSFSPDEAAALYDYTSEDVIDYGFLDQIEKASAQISTFGSFVGVDPTKISFYAEIDDTAYSVKDSKVIDGAKEVETKKASVDLGVKMKEGFITPQAIDMIIPQLNERLLPLLEKQNIPKEEYDLLINAAKEVLPQLRSITFKAKYADKCYELDGFTITANEVAQAKFDELAPALGATVSKSGTNVSMNITSKAEKVCLKDSIKQISEQISSENGSDKAEVEKILLNIVEDLDSIVYKQTSGKWYPSIYGNFGKVLFSIADALK